MSVSYTHLTLVLDILVGFSYNIMTVRLMKPEKDGLYWEKNMGFCPALCRAGPLLTL